MKYKLALVAGAVMTLMATSASAVDWGGYVRIGPGQKASASKPASLSGNRCFDGLTGVGHGGIGRLGNECGTYGEFQLSQGAQAGGVNYKALLMTNFSNDGSDPDGNQVKVNQIYVEGKGYDVAPDQTFWIGRRFYHRADVHFDDSFFINMSGSGAGVDGFKVGSGSLSVAGFRAQDGAASANGGSRLNVDLEGLAVNPGGKLRLTAVYTDFSGTGGKDGYGLSLQHTQTGVFGGENTLWAQMAQGSAGLDMNFSGSKTAATDGSDVKSWRIADSVAWLKGPITGQTLVQLGEQKTKATGTDKFWSIGGRGAYALSKNFKLQAELGYAQLKPHLGSSQNVTKFTIAPTLTVGQDYYDRPELRFYVSTFRFNDAYKLANGQNKSSKTAVGLQAELWF
jgi:maltoporin